MTANLVRVTAPHFVAGLVARDGVVIETAPILYWARGMDTRDVAAYFKRKGWTYEIIKEQPQ